MKIIENRRLQPVILADDETTFNALQKIASYAPTNASISVAALTQAFNEMRAAQVAEDQAEAELAAARDKAASKEWEIHNLLLAVKDQVRSQFGKYSLEVQQIGLKRRSDYKSRKPKATPPVKPVTP
jgi:hypothetical protein